MGTRRRLGRSRGGREPGAIRVGAAAGTVALTSLLLAPSFAPPSAAGTSVRLATSSDAALTATEPPCPASTSDAHTIRLAGSNRFATAACGSRVAEPTGAPSVLLARGDAAGGYADALAGSILARNGGPMLLTHPAVLPDATRAELLRLRPRYVGVLGGPQAVHPSVVDEIRRLLPGVTVERLGGPDRYETAVTISLRARGDFGAFVVNGHRPADALTAGPPAGREFMKVLLTARDRLPEPTRRLLRTERQAVIVGGVAAVSEEVEAEIVDLVGEGRVERVAGPTRSATAVALARRFPDAAWLYLANGADARLADAVTAGWMATSPAAPGDDESSGGNVLLVQRDQLGLETESYLLGGGLPPGRHVRLVGGTGVLRQGVVDELVALRRRIAGGG